MVAILYAVALFFALLLPSAYYFWILHVIARRFTKRDDQRYLVGSMFAISLLAVAAALGTANPDMFQTGNSSMMIWPFLYCVVAGGLAVIIMFFGVLGIAFRSVFGVVRG